MFRIGARCGLSLFLALVSVLAALGGEPVTAKTPVKKGDTLLAEWAGKWEEVQVLDVLPGGNLKIRWTKWGPQWDGPMARTKLRLPDGKAPARGADGAVKASGGKRTWTDSTGKFKIDAEFVSLASEQVQLLRPDGKLITLPIEKLSAADQEQARKLAKEASMAAPSTNPFEENVASVPKFAVPNGAVPSGAAPAAPDDFKTVPGDWSRVAQLTASLAGPPALPAAAPVAPPSYPIRSIALTPSPEDRLFSFHERTESVLFAPGTGNAWIVHVNAHGGAKIQARLERVDLAEGKSAAVALFATKSRPLAVDPAGHRVLTAPSDITARNIVDLWELDEKTGQPKHLFRWAPFQPQGAIQFAAAFANFVDDDHVLVGNDWGGAVLWQLSTMRAVYSLPLASGGRPELSGDRKLLAAPQAAEIGIYEALSGKTLGKLDRGNWQRVAFRPDGKQLAAADGWGVATFDCQTGKRLTETAFNTYVSLKTLDWAGANHLLVNGSLLIDPRLRVTIWKYERSSATTPVLPMGDAFWYVSSSPGREQQSLQGAVLPHPAVEQVAAGLQGSDLLVFQPGTKVRLEILTSLSDDEQNKITTHLTSQLKQAGATVVDDASLTLTAIIEAGEAKAINYSRFGFGRGGDAGIFTEQKYRLSLHDGDTTLWHLAQTQGAPGSLHLKRDQTVEQALEEASQPKPQFFLNARIPKLITRPGPYDGAYGKTALP